MITIKNRIQTNAINKVHNEIKYGRICKEYTCELCGKLDEENAEIRSEIEGHHPDYRKPLFVIWLCQSCHKDWHKIVRQVRLIPIMNRLITLYSN